MQYTSTLFALAAGLTTVSAHGLLTSPKPRLAGAAFKAACGEQVFNNQNSDAYGNIQGELQVAKGQSDFKAAECNIWLCKGFKAADNTANVQSWTAGQVVDFKFDVRAPHTGTANVSIVNTATNSIIGSPLITYADFADNSKPTPAEDTAFSITIPSGLESTCATAGACVVQHFWDARSIDQTYESCVDFTIGGSSGSTPAASSSAAAPVASSAAPVASSVSAPSTVPATSALAQASNTAAVPTTLQTIVKPSTTAAAPATSATAAPVTNTPATDDGEDDCE